MAHKDVFSLRADSEQISKAQNLGINLSALFQDALEKALKEKKCPVCKRKFTTGFQPVAKED